ncbi:MAG: hypothetical protein U9N87_00825, partial [Planctomycetota bacterium]|nr:hypothetical protein [Planctomycetota bacterium]
RSRAARSERPLDHQHLAISPPPQYYEGEWPPKQQYLPTKYNEKSELEITVSPDDGEITKDFDLAN